MNAEAPKSGDVDLSGGAAVAGGPNDAHVNETKEEFEQRIDAEREVERAENDALEAAEEAREAGEEPTWPGNDDDPEVSGESPSSNGQAGAPSRETPTAPPSSGESPPASAAPTAEGDGEGEPESPVEPEPEPEPEPGEPESRSGAASRPYTLLEEQEVVPFHLLTDAQKKALAKHKAVGYVERGTPVVARNIEAALSAVYGEDGLPEHVSRALPLSERAYQPVALDLEPVQRSRLRIRR